MVLFASLVIIQVAIATLEAHHLLQLTCWQPGPRDVVKPLHSFNKFHHLARQMVRLAATGTARHPQQVGEHLAQALANGARRVLLVVGMHQLSPCRNVVIVAPSPQLAAWAPLAFSASCEQIEGIQEHAFTRAPVAQPIEHGPRWLTLARLKALASALAAQGWRSTLFSKAATLIAVGQSTTW